MISEADWEVEALEAFARLEWTPRHGTDIKPGTDGGRRSWSELLLPDVLLGAMKRLNPLVPGRYLEQALAEITGPESQDALAENFRIHRFVVEGYRGVTYIDADGTEQTPTIRLIGARPADNDFAMVNQVTLRSRDHERRFDLVGYVNGMPMIIVELKRAGSASATLEAAHAQLDTYLHEFGLAFRWCAIAAISDGLLARYGTPWTPLNHYAPWNVDDEGRRLGSTTDPENLSVGVELEYLIDGIGNQQRFLSLLTDFTAFDVDAGRLAKRIAKPHQYFAVTAAVRRTVAAARSDGKIGVVWHTQGSGKSMEMELYTHLVGSQPELKNPTVIVVTDRTELDTQLFETFQHSQLVGEPVSIASRAQLRAELRDRMTGGIFFTTLQKFSLDERERAAGLDHPQLSDRRNIIVVVDEAHRSHYDALDGFARHIRDALPHAAFIAFTGTPVSFADRDTRAVFGDVIDVYDLTRAVADGATVPVRFEPRLVSVKLASNVTEEQLDEAADEATQGLDDTERARIEQAVAVINAVYGAPERVKALAADIVAHWEQRADAMRPFIGEPGRAFVVCATREICARLYDEIVALRPDWHDDAIDKGVIKVVYSGSASDVDPVRRHVRRESQNKIIRERIKDEHGDPLQLILVKDMMLTGFDAPPLHTLYLDRPLQGAQLMQTLARVNRTYRGKPDGLLVAYAPLAENLSAALAEYTETDQATQPVGRDISEEVALVRQLLATLDGLCAGLAWRRMLDGSARSWIDAAKALTNWLRSPTTPGNQVGEGEESLAGRFRKLSGQVARAWALAGGSPEIADLRATAKFYEEVRVWMAKYDAHARQAAGLPVPQEIQLLLSGLVANAAAAGDVVDIFEAAGLPKPALDQLGPDYVRTAQQAKNPHLAIEALRDLLLDESASVTRDNLTRQRAFSERIKELMNRYTNQQLTSAEVIAELIQLARDVAAEGARGADFDPPLDHNELAFFDAVATNESALLEQGTDVLAQIARDLVMIMRRDVKTDWTTREDVQAKLRSAVKRLLVKYRYPPDKQPDAIRRVIEQMESLAARTNEKG